MSQRLADRYGRAGRPGARRGRWTAIGLGVIVVLAGVGIAYLGFRSYGPQDIDAEVVSSRIVDDSTMNITLTVTRKHPDQPVVCIIRARSRDGSESGRREVLVPASKDSSVTIDSVVRTSARPVVGELFGCGGSVPAYLKANRSSN